MQTGSDKDRTVIHCHNVVLKLNGPLIFKNFKSKTDSIIVVKATNVTMHGHIEFFNNSTVSLLSEIEINSVQLKENLLLNISKNKFYAEIFNAYWTTEIFNHTVIIIMKLISHMLLTIC